MKDIAETCKDAREKAGLSIYKLAKLSGVSPAVINDTEKGHTSPTVDTLRRIYESAGMRVAVKITPPRKRAAPVSPQH